MPSAFHHHQPQAEWTAEKENFWHIDTAPRTYMGGKIPQIALCIVQVSERNAFACLLRNFFLLWKKMFLLRKKDTISVVCQDRLRTNATRTHPHPHTNDGRRRAFLFSAGLLHGDLDDGSGRLGAVPECQRGGFLVRKTPSFEAVILKRIIFPRQARDKHRERALKKERRVLCRAKADAQLYGTAMVLLLALAAGAVGVLQALAVSGADMAVVICVLNSGSGWSGVAAGFMISNELLLITGAFAEKNAFFAPFIYKTIILPRQAQDKHGENSKTEALFAGAFVGASGAILR